MLPMIYGFEFTIEMGVVGLTVLRSMQPAAWRHAFVTKRVSAAILKVVTAWLVSRVETPRESPLSASINELFLHRVISELHSYESAFIAILTTIEDTGSRRISG
jgi:hypothetical protein